MNRWDAVWLLLWLAATLLECLRLSWGRQLWSDEIFGWVMARDPSLRHMFAAWRLGADGGGIFYYLTARAWMDVFGYSALALRMFTAFFMGVALALTWVTSRRWYRLEVVAVSLPFCWFTAHSMLRQMMVGRFYGLLIAAVAAAVLCYGVTAEEASLSLPKLGIVFAAHCFLVGTHPFGLLYSAAIIAAIIASDVFRRRWRPWLYSAAIAGWWILWPSRAAMSASAAVGKPHFWTTTPVFADLCDALAFWTDEIQWLGLFILICIAVRWLIIRRTKRPTQIATVDPAAVVIGVALVAVIPALWLISLHGTSYFVDRYLLPTILGAALLLCAALEWLVPEKRPVWLSWSVGSAVLATACGTVWGAIWDMPNFYTIPPHSYTSRMASILPRNVPVVIERVDIFAESIVAEPEISVHYLLDGETAQLPESLRGEVSGYHEMQNWQISGYYASAIQPSEQFLAQEREFWVVSDPSELWFTHRVQNNPAFTVERMGEFRRESDVETIWHVRRKD